MNGIVVGALMMLGMMQQQTDTVVPLDGATRVEVDAPGGTVTIGVWDRNEVRVRAEHSMRSYVEIDRQGSTLDIEAEADRGPANIVDFVITVPRSIDVEVDGQYTDVLIEGVDGEIEADAGQGTLTIRGGSGSVQAETVTGRILIEGTRGRVEAESAAGEIRIRDASGEIFAESAGSDIVLENVTATALDVGSVGGRIYFSGGFAPSGTYFFGSHGGSVTLALPPDQAASFTLSTLHGTITSNLNGAPERFERGRRNSFRVNGGGPVVEVETFGGRIRVVRQGTDGASPPSRQGS